MISKINNKLRVFIPMLICMIIMLSGTAYAAESVYDDAGLFYGTEINDLQAQAKALSDKTGWDVIVVTTADAQGKTSAAYADDYYDNIGGGENGVLYLLDMDNGELYVSTSGEAINYLSDKRIDSMLDESINYAYDGDYAKAISSEISMTDSFYSSGIPGDSQSTTVMITVLLAALIIGGIASVIAVLTVKKSYDFKEAGNIYEYSSKSNVNLTANSDRLVNSFVTTRIRPRPPRGGGGGGFGGGSSVHTSSSGRTHGGGGRSFR